MQVGFAFPSSQWPLWLAVGALVVAMVYGLLRRYERKRAGRLRRFVDAALAPRLLVAYEERVRRPLFWLPLVGTALLLVALAQPHFGSSWREVRQQSRDVLVLFDTSDSMRAADLRPDRLEHAKRKVEYLMEQMPGDRFGLIAFAGAASLQCPLTLDHGYFKAILAGTDTRTVSLKGTNIAEALRLAVDTFEADAQADQEVSRHNRAIVLISDGETVSGDAIAAAEAAGRYGHVYVLGVGDPAGSEVRVPEWMAGIGGQVARTHLSKLDEDTLIRVAQTGNGVYTRATNDTWDMDQIAGRIHELSGRLVDSEQRMRLVNRYQWPLALAIGCFALEGLWLVVLPRLRAWRLRRNEESREYA